MTMRITGILFNITLAAGIAGLLSITVPVSAQNATSLSEIAAAGDEVIYQPSPESFIRIEGSSNVNEFTCTSDRVNGHARVSPNADGTEDTHVEVALPVRGLDCGKRQMNRDLFRTLKADEHPEIQFELIQAYIVGTAQGGDGNSYQIRVEGHLTVAGSTRFIVFDTTGEMQAGNRYSIKGKKDILMTDFGLEPPTALLGLVKARDKLVVHFELLAHI
jgi:polyisoprenoid-binding protein YceI